jgi:hypothetical protein
MATVGVLFVLLGGLLMLPPEPVRALIDGSPLRFLRAPWRFVAIAGLGTALLSTALLETLRARLSPAFAAAAMVGIAALVLGTQGRRLVVNGLDPVPALAFDRAMYEAVGRIAAERDPDRSSSSPSGTPSGRACGATSRARSPIPTPWSAPPCTASRS